MTSPSSPQMIRLHLSSREIHMVAFFARIRTSAARLTLAFVVAGAVGLHWHASFAQILGSHWN
jgi:hypothetical protein